MAKKVERFSPIFSILKGREVNEMPEQIEAVQRMQDYIREHLFEEITLDHLAQAALFSPWHAYRLFAQYLRMTPADYIRRLRLSTSVLRLRDGVPPCRVTDVAFACGFSSVDGFQRAFRREFGCNPSEYLAKPAPLYLFTPYGVKFRERKRRTAMKPLKQVFIQVIQKPQRRVIVKRGKQASDYFTYCAEVGCEVWGLLQSMKSIGGEPVCLWLPERCRTPGTSEYVQGVEVPMDYDGVVPQGFDVIDLPEAEYLMFQGEPFEEENDSLAIEEVWQAIQKYDPAVIGYAWDKENPRIQLEPLGTRGYIELVPIRRQGVGRELDENLHR